DPMKSAFNAKGVTGVLVRYKTFTGNLPAQSWLRLNLEGQNLPSDVSFVGNVFSDPTGTMAWFCESAPAAVGTVSLADNVIWNGGRPVPITAGNVVQPTSDPEFAQPGLDPRLPAPPTTKIAVPRWVPSTGLFGA